MKSSPFFMGVSNCTVHTGTKQMGVGTGEVVEAHQAEDSN